MTQLVILNAQSESREMILVFSQGPGMCHPYLGWVFLALLNFLGKTLVDPPRGMHPRGFQIQAALTIEMKKSRC